jgi:predicted acyl esterase
MKKTLLIALSFMLLAFCAHAQPKGPDADYIKANYTKYEYSVPMRDGKKLFTSVYVPKDQTKKYPIMMDRTPYSVAPYGIDAYKAVLAHHRYLYMMVTYLFTRMCAAAG